MAGTASTWQAVKSLVNRVTNAVPVVNYSQVIHLTEEMNSEAYEAIIHDDVNGLCILLNTGGHSFQNLMINGKFAYPQEPDSGLPKNYCRLAFERPIILAGAYGATNCLVKLLQIGTNSLVLDMEQCNVVHAIILSVSKTRDLEAKYMETYSSLIRNIDIKTRRHLLSHEDSSGYTPLELAASYGCYGLFRLILDTPGVYMEILDQRGIQTLLEYDLTQYESGAHPKRECHSPLNSMVYMRSEYLPSFLDNNLHRMPVIKSWINYRVRTRIPFVVVMMALKLVFISLAYIWTFETFWCVPDNSSTGNSSTGNSKNTTAEPHFDLRCPKTLAVWLLTVLYCSFLILHTTITFFCQFVSSDGRQLFKALTTKSDYVAYTSFYNITEFLLALMVFVSCIVTYVVDDISYAYLFKACYFPLLLIEVLSIVELLPGIGTFAITMQTMIVLFINFVIATSIIKCLFAMFFMHIYWTDVGFPTATFRILLLETGFTNVDENAEDYVRVAYLIFFYLSAVMLMNYLIAVMTSEATNSAEVKDMVQALRRLQATFEAEAGVGHIIQKMRACAQKGKRLIVEVVHSGNNTHYYEQFGIKQNFTDIPLSKQVNGLVDCIPDDNLSSNGSISELPSVDYT